MKNRDEIIDLVRSICALLVLAGHARNFVMFDFDMVVDHSSLSKFFYLLTSMHHEAVIVFVLLSGYFIGGSVVGALRENRFKWSNYGVDRMSRLWIVLVPGLFLTLALDSIGMLINRAAYEGAYRHLFVMGPTFDNPAMLNIWVFLGNMFSLQTILVPTYGSNGPLWSLSFLFWYDVLFPAVLCGILNTNAPKVGRCAFAVLFVCGIIFLPKALLFKGTIWLVGVCVWFASQYPPLKRAANSWIWRIVGGAVFAALLIASKTGLKIPNIVIATIFGVWMLSLLGAWSVQGWWSKVSKWFSEMSFSLYVIHFPAMFLIATCLLRGQQFEPSNVGMFWFFGLCIVSVLLARIYWSLFESNTGTFRKMLKFVLFRTHLHEVESKTVNKPA
jgi:peptidoglycan/LPS O-acetylase OafA/YrhL